ncbi:type II secretion system protein [uncultured Cetobacterium sp.]|uniref:type II secretion system protein n=1 Tax=uncultured Cetobacterium sp. TaxID=527638 RepID=UPI00261FA157|nr:type II secretion system protein [uncultured Cetobacterium sp.]
MRKEKGFSVIEIVLVLGVIGILSSFIVPKTRDYLAMAKDSKVINTLNSLRMASESYYLEKGEYAFEGENKTLVDALPNLSKYMRDSLKVESDKILLEIGGSKKMEESEESVVYGGKVEVYIDNNKEIVLKPFGEVGNFNMRGEEWSKM